MISLNLQCFRQFRLIDLTLGLILSLWCLSSTAQSTELINIGLVSGQQDSENTFSPFSDYLNSRIPEKDFQVTGYTSIEELMEAVENQVLDFAFISPAAFVDLNLENELRILSTITQRSGDTYSPWLAGAVITLDSRTDISTMSDVRDKQVIALSELTLGGWLSAVREWQDLGLTPDNDFTVDFEFSYSAILEKVCNGETDIGVIGASILASIASECNQPLKILPPPTNTQNISYPLSRSTRLYPEVAFTMIGLQQEEFVRNLTQALLDIEPDSDIALSVFVCGFTAPLLYTEVQALMQELGLDPFQPVLTKTLTQLLSENIYLVTFSLLGIILLTSAGFVNAHVMSRKFRESENFRKKLFEDSQIAMVVVDPESRTYLDMNQAAVKLYGYKDKKELVGQSLTHLTAENQNIDYSIPEAFERNTRKVYEKGEYSFEWRHKRPNGEEWAAMIHLMSLETKDGPLIQAVVEDISQQKRIAEERLQLEKQLEFSQRMESIGRLAGSIAHDFNNLLTIINGYSEYMLDDEPENTQQKEILQQINKAGLRASELTQQLLTFSRKQVIKQMPVNIDEIIKDSAGMMKSALGEENTLVLELGEVDGYVMADPGQVQQVIINLVMNAKDAMPDGGTLRISTKTVYISFQIAKRLDLSIGEYLELCVQDDGIGMDENIAKHIFEPFFTTKENMGTGLGLSTVYGIIRQSLGNIQVESEKGRGTIFKILLPTTEAQDEVSIEEPIKINLPDKDYTVLVVEDQKEVLSYIFSVLDSAGIKTISAASANEALTKLAMRKEPVDLLLTDVVMEGMSGGELAEKFMIDYPGVPVIFTSGYPEDEIIRYGVNREAMNFLAKPFSPNELLSRITHALNNATVDA